MALITGSWCLDAFAIFTSIIAVTIAYLKWSFTYWESRGVRSLPAKLPFGNATEIFKQRISFSEELAKAYKVFKGGGLKHCGFYFFARPMYVPLDVEIIKHIMQKDFQHFVNHGIYYNEKDDPLSAHLFRLEDEKWRNLRAKLTPTFTSGKLKAMFQTLVDCTGGLTTIMDESAGGEAVDIKEVLGRFTTDVIGSCAFGIECNSLKDPNAEFRRHGRMIFEIDRLGSLSLFVQFVFPRSLLNRLGLKVLKPQVRSFFTNVVRETVEYRERNNVHRKDFMHLLLQLKNRGEVVDDGKIQSDGATKKEFTLTMDELSAQAFVFFAAGFETSSTTMTFALYELATNVAVQQRLRKEIREVLAKHDNKMTYEALTEMAYMEMVINETLRKYPPVGILNRLCNKDYRVPGTGLLIRKGIHVTIPVLGIHKDPEYYPNPEAFLPERFSEVNKSKRPAFTFLPFGDGPRICIGMRFGIMQTKVGLTAILRDYGVSLDERTKSPLEMDPRTFISAAKGGVWLKVRKLRI